MISARGDEWTDKTACLTDEFTTGSTELHSYSQFRQDLIKKMYRVVHELTQLECGCWYQERGLFLVRFRACDTHSLERGGGPA